jgi:hypothetical protein
MFLPHVMVDLETLGNVPGSIILSIGARDFDPARGVMGTHSFYAVISTASCRAAGLTSDASTAEWWGRQAPEVSAVLRAALHSPLGLKVALLNFNTFLASCGPDVCLWGNGADFDNALLNVAYRAVGLAPSWDFRNNRCFRTLRSLWPDVRGERIGTAHKADDDAATQAAHAVRIFQARADEAAAYINPNAELA